MRIGITFNLKSTPPPGQQLPDDFQEEFDSPQTIEAITGVLRDLGHRVDWLGDGREFLHKVLADPPDFIFNFAEGTGISRSREARVPAVCEMLGIPYTGSDPLTMAVTLDKDCAKKLAAAAGVSVPGGKLLETGVPLSSEDLSQLQFPLLVKPAWEGSSKGIRNRCLVHSPASLAEVVHTLQQDHPQPLLLEEFIEGDEITVGILGNEEPEILGVMQVVPRVPQEHFIYSLEVKREYQKLVNYHCPPLLSPGVLETIERASRTVYRVLGCRDVARVDFRVRNGVPYFLEVNPLPGLNPLDSDLVILARLAGWTYPRLIGAILQFARKRYEK